MKSNKVKNGFISNLVSSIGGSKTKKLDNGDYIKGEVTVQVLDGNFNKAREQLITRIDELLVWLETQPDEFVTESDATEEEEEEATAGAVERVENATNAEADAEKENGGPEASAESVTDSEGLKEFRKRAEEYNRKHSVKRKPGAEKKPKGPSKKQEKREEENTEEEQEALKAKLLSEGWSETKNPLILWKGNGNGEAKFISLVDGHEWTRK